MRAFGLDRIPCVCLSWYCASRTVGLPLHFYKGLRPAPPFMSMHVFLVGFPHSRYPSSLPHGLQHSPRPGILPLLLLIRPLPLTGVPSTVCMALCIDGLQCVYRSPCWASRIVGLPRCIRFGLRHRPASGCLILYSITGPPALSGFPECLLN